jgi:hypothetical protein
MEAICRICSAERGAAPPAGPCTACGALPFLGWAPDLHVERDEDHVVVVLPPEGKADDVPWIAIGAGFGVLLLVMLILRGPGAALMMIGATALPIAGGAMLYLDRSRESTRVEIRGGEIRASYGYVIRGQESIPLAEVRSVAAQRWWNRARGFGATLVVQTRAGQRMPLFPPRGSDALVVSAERVLAPYLTRSR